MSFYVMYRLDPDHDGSWAEIECEDEKDIEAGLLKIISGGRFVPVEIMKVEKA